MLKQSLCLFLITSLVSMLSGCYSRYQLRLLEPTKGEIKKEIEVLTTQGQTHRLISYQITDKKIIGKDKNGKYYEEFLENIQSVTIISRLNKAETIVVSTFLVGLAFFFYYYFSIKGFSGLR